MKNKKLKKKIIRDFKAGKYREVKGKEKYQEMASHTKDSWPEDEKIHLKNEFEWISHGDDDLILDKDKACRKGSG